MKSKVYSIFVLCFLFFFSSDCRLMKRKKTVPATDFITETLELQGKTRSYHIHYPQNKAVVEKKLPLLFVLHGRLGTGRQIMEQSRFNDLADEEGFIVVYPDGYSRSWADGRGNTPADREKINDVLFLETVLQNLIRKGSVDPSRVFMVGHSNGGFMTQRMSVDRSSLFKGTASVAAQLSIAVLKNGEPSSPLSVALFSGTGDPLVPYYGGYVRDGGEIIGAEDTIDRWKKWNRCSDSVVVSEKDTSDDGTSLEIRTYSTCAKGTKVRLYKIKEGGHAWPGQKQNVPFVDMGKPTYELDAAKEVWEFFKSL
ncbi:extracellular catalytic domain type 1 short-chain-length polyhydroxyalkanoate depolymerase [Leptospira idonii]|uniref:extracellular catalytic domain type 1 short-chain-length polyhydroxyalkanoate depolymerase n=1 Tax=Leptospira idonii TaxID=1193500 RepID=UPI0014384D53|nr:PHB depolymerase family esterase [Leptospira idonii]